MFMGSETLRLTLPLGQEALGGSSRLGVEDWDKAFPSTYSPAYTSVSSSLTR